MLKDLFGVADSNNVVDDDLNRFCFGMLENDFDRRVGIDDRGRFGRRDDDHFAGCGEYSHHVVTDSGRSVDQKIVESSVRIL